tara:strand:+ start:451 stop:759 length:309 start_codon:yes stop_codon:yes gene_type:complete
MSLPSKQSDLVKFILERCPEARDNDNILLWIMWKKEYPIIETDPQEFKKLFISKQLPSMESVTRARRKMQEVHEHLRGIKYNQRQNNQKLYQENLGYNVSRH